jgi:hypothetical protein
MKMKNFIPVVFLAFFLLIGGCKKEVDIPTFGCHDLDSPRSNLNTDYHDSTCVYMYVSEFEITYFEDKSWDPLNPLFDEADIVLKFGDANMDSIYFDSYRITNADATERHTWVAHTQFQLKNQLYAWELHNEATVLFLESDELMTSGLLNPLDFKNDSVIVMTDSIQNTQIKIRYEIR